MTTPNQRIKKRACTLERLDNESALRAVSSMGQSWLASHRLTKSGAKIHVAACSKTFKSKS
jgi:hypothetical protein